MINKYKKLFVVVLVINLFISTSALANGTGVIINGAQLSYAELAQLQMQIGAPVPPARYWFNAQTGQWGYEGGPAMGSLYGNQYSNGGGDSTFYRNGYTGIGSGSSGGCNYVIGSDFSYTGSGC